MYVYRGDGEEGEEEVETEKEFERRKIGDEAVLTVGLSPFFFL